MLFIKYILIVIDIKSIKKKKQYILILYCVQIKFNNYNNIIIIILLKAITYFSLPLIIITIIPTIAMLVIIK